MFICTWRNIILQWDHLRLPPTPERMLSCFTNLLRRCLGRSSLFTKLNSENTIDLLPILNERSSENEPSLKWQRQQSSQQTLHRYCDTPSDYKLEWLSAQLKWKRKGHFTSDDDRHEEASFDWKTYGESMEITPTTQMFLVLVLFVFWCV